MSRPAHIAPLDTALAAARQAEADAAEHLAAFELEHADILGDHEDARSAKQRTARDAEQIEQAIRDLGYSILRATSSDASTGESA